jgi:dephospho-CoA kinase
MRVIAITGGIGSGKSTGSKLFASLGAALGDADAESRALTAAGGEALPAVRDAFGADVFFSDGTLNRKALANVIFKDESARERLNALLHPLITDRVRAKLDAFRAQGRAAALLDVPLLFETGMDRLADAVVCVTAPEETRVRRVCRRDGLTREEALRRIRSQNPAAVTESLSDYVLSTDAPYALTRMRARELWRRILADGPLRPVG